MVALEAGILTCYWQRVRSSAGQETNDGCLGKSTLEAHGDDNGGQRWTMTTEDPLFISIFVVFS